MPTVMTIWTTNIMQTCHSSATNIRGSSGKAGQSLEMILVVPVMVFVVPGVVRHQPPFGTAPLKSDAEQRYSPANGETVECPPEHPFKPDIVLKKKTKNEFLHFGTWIPDSKPFQPVPGRKFHIESEFEIKNSHIQHPGGQQLGKTTSRNFIVQSVFFYLIICSIGSQGQLSKGCLEQCPLDMYHDHVRTCAASS